MSECPIGLPGECPGPELYPPGYRDPSYERGNLSQFAERVFPARHAAVLKGLNDHLAAHGFGDLHFERTRG